MRRRLFRPLRHWVGLTILAGASGLTLASILLIGTFLFKRQYRATAKFSPESGSASRVSGSLAELASQFQLDLGSQGIKPLPYYSVVLRSDVIIDRVLDSRLDLPEYPATLWDYLEPQFSHRDSLPREKVRKWLRDRVAVTADNRATTMDLAVTLPDRRVAAVAVNNFLKALNAFNSSSRASQARSRREYLEHALTLQLDSLRRTEDTLQVFLERNRSYRDSPALEFQQTRLRRQVDLNQQVVSTIQRDLQAARLDEINETPILSVIDSGSAPFRAVFPKRRLSAVFGLVLGMVAVVYLVVLGQTQSRPRNQLALCVTLRVVNLDRRLRRRIRGRTNDTPRRSDAHGTK
jgi:uncharacterized protein involved in exopolysaccharide biosynthesis